MNRSRDVDNYWYECEIDVEDQDITHYWDEWQFNKGGCESRYWNVKSRRVDCLTGHPCFYTKGCKHCTNNHFDSLEIWHAENGTEIRLWDDSKGFGSDDDVVIIKFLKDFNWKTSSGKLAIEGLEKSETTEYYKMTYYPHNGLNGEVSQLFMHFANRPEWS